MFYDVFVSCAMPQCPSHPGKSVKKIAIIGSVADSESYDPAGATQGLGKSWFSGDYYSGGGSGHLTGNVTTTLQGLSARAALEGIEIISSPTDNLTAAEEAARHRDDDDMIQGRNTCYPPVCMLISCDCNVIAY